MECGAHKGAREEPVIYGIYVPANLDHVYSEISMSERIRLTLLSSKSG